VALLLSLLSRTSLAPFKKPSFSLAHRAPSQLANCLGQVMQVAAAISVALAALCCCN